MAQAWQVKLANASRKLVLVKLADNANDEGVCWPSYNHLAEQCEMDRRTVIRHVDDLVLTGFVKKTYRKGGVNFNKSNMFQLTINQGDISNLKALKEALKTTKNTAEKVVVKDTPSDNLSLGVVVADDHPTSVTGSPDLVADDHLTSVTGSPRTIIEPSIEPSIEPLSKKQSKKPDYIRYLFDCYPAHRRGGTDAQFWKVWQQEKLDYKDAEQFDFWLSAAAENDPAQWGIYSNGQFVLGLTKFVRERHWLTPVPVPSDVNKPADFHSGDTSWSEDLGDL